MHRSDTALAPGPDPSNDHSTQRYSKGMTDPDPKSAFVIPGPEQSRLRTFRGTPRILDSCRL